MRLTLNGIESHPKSQKESKREKGESIRDNISDYTVVDLETTGKYVTSCEIIELAAVKVRGGKTVDTFNTLVKPPCKVSDEVVELTGITNEMLENAPEISEVIESYIEFIGDDIILGHNIAAFDSNIIYDNYYNCCNKLFQNQMLDTYHYARCCDIDVSDYKLTTLTEYFNIEHEAHRALGDCIANFKCYEKLKSKFTGDYTKASRDSDESSNSPLEVVINTQYSEISGKTIVLTGDFRIGKRNLIKAKLEESGSKVTKSVSGKTDYVIIGSLGNPNWKFGEYGDKANKAKELQEKGKPVRIIKEEEFFNV